MSQPVQHVRDAIGFGALGNFRTVDHDDRYAQSARRNQLCLRARAAGILGYDQIYAMLLHQRDIAVDGEGAAVDQDFMIGQGGRTGRPVDEAQQIVMMRLGCKGIDVHSAKRQHDPARRTIQQGNGVGDIVGVLPLVPDGRFPRRAGQRDIGYAAMGRRDNRMIAHRRGERVGRVYQMGDGMIADVAAQPVHAAEPTDADRDGLGAGMRHTARIAQYGGYAAIRKGAGERTGFRRAAQDQDGADV